MNIKVVSFDIGGTLLLQKRTRTLKSYLTRYALADVHTFNEAYKKHFVERRTTLTEFYNEIRCVDKMQFNLAIDEYYANYPKPLVYNDVLSTLVELKLRGILLMAISNKSYRNPFSLAAYGLSKYFDVEIYSYECHSAKPDERIFRYGQQVIEKGAHEILHVGDSIVSDVQGANKMNWLTGYIKRGGNIDKVELETPNFFFRDLNQILTIIDMYNQR